jgi:hypothetical protein
MVVVWSVRMKEILERLEQKMDRRFDTMDRRFDAVDGRFDAVDGRFDAMDGRLGEVEGQLQKQGVLQESMSGDVKMALEGIAGNREVLDMKFAEVVEKLDERIQPVELVTRQLAAKTAKPR